MHLFINLVKVLIVISVVECYNFSLSLENGSGLSDSDNEGNNTLVDIDIKPSEEKDKVKIAIGRKSYVISDHSGIKEHEISAETVNTVTETDIIENITRVYQNNITSQEEQDESKTTLVDFPFSVSIQKKGAHYVSGALIGPDWVLSVAGEFFNVRDSLKLFRARLGSVDCKKGGTLVPLKKIEIHPYYIYGKPNFDVSLVRLARPVDFSDVIQPITISRVKGKVLSAKFMTTYWPRIVRNGRTLSEDAKERTKYNSIRVSTQKLIPSNLCRNVLRAIKETIHESSFCLKPVVTHHSVCMPDAGAPVLAEDGLWGITSGWISPTCPFLAAPTIFTRVSSSSVRSWLGTQLPHL